jgi:HK97 family phage major capsid protein
MTPTEMHAFSLPVADDSANSGQAQSQTSTSGTELDPTDASLSFTPNLYSSKQFWYSNTMVLGQSFDVLGFTLPMAQKRVEKQRETLWTASILASGTLGVTTASPITMTYDELLTWEHSLPVAYRADACFVLADSLFKVMRGIKDDQHRPIFDQDPTNTFQGRIHGKPVLVCDALSAVAANTVVGAFCSADALKILDIQNQRLARYSNLPTKPDQIGFELFENGDFQFIPNGMRLAKTAIS